jgi:hypothetical protein
MVVASARCWRMLSQARVTCARVHRGTDATEFARNMYQWASTLTQSGANLPFSLPLRADKLSNGFQVRFLCCRPAVCIGIGKRPSTTRPPWYTLHIALTTQRATCQCSGCLHLVQRRTCAHAFHLLTLAAASAAARGVELTEHSCVGGFKCCQLANNGAPPAAVRAEQLPHACR